MVTEDALDEDVKDVSTNDFVSSLIQNAVLLLKCRSCGRLIVLDEKKGKYEVQFYLPEQENAESIDGA